MRDKPCKPIRLTTEEALGLLDIILFSTGELSEPQYRVLLKLSRFCRVNLKNEDQIACADDASRRPDTGTDDDQQARFDTN